MAAEDLLAHLREEHEVVVELPLAPEPLRQAAADMHRAMHNGRAHPGHFHDRAGVLRLWQASDRIEQVDTGGVT